MTGVGDGGRSLSLTCAPYRPAARSNSNNRAYHDTPWRDGWRPPVAGSSRRPGYLLSRPRNAHDMQTCAPGLMNSNLCAFLSAACDCELFAFLDVVCDSVVCASDCSMCFWVLFVFPSVACVFESSFTYSSGVCVSGCMCFTSICLSYHLLSCNRCFISCST